MSENGSVPERDGKCFETSYKKTEITRLRVLFTIWSLFAYIADVGSDIYTAVKHHQNGNVTYCYLTILFAFLPALIMSLESLKLYVNQASLNCNASSTKEWIIRIIFVIFLMAPALRCSVALYYAWKSYKSVSAVDKEIYAQGMFYESVDASTLRLIEAFGECAPQIILQIYIIAKVHCETSNDISTTDIIQLISIAISLISMTNAIVSYFRYAREYLDYKKELTLCVSIFLILWRFLDLTARVVALGLFASVLLPYFFLLCGIHFCAMFLWISSINTDFCKDNKFGKFVYNVVFSFACIFCFMNPKDDNTRIRYSLYCSIIFVENTVIISIWYHHCSFQARLIVLIMVFVCFFMSIIIMVFYYVLLHPTRGTLFREPSPEERNVRSESKIIVDQFSVSRELIDRTKREIGTSEEMQTATKQNEKPTSEEMQTATVQNGKPIEVIISKEEKGECSQSFFFI